jgi:pyruvate dehydrogenase E2 component (dihydrolipoamide acetyltransferase)
MPIEILMPALSPTMTEGNLAKWTKKEGDKIKPGDVIAEIETDKATMEVEAVDEGILGKIVVNGGSQGVKVNQLIALLLADGEDKKAIDSYKIKQVEAKKEEAKPTASAASSAPAASAAPAASQSLAPKPSLAPVASSAPKAPSVSIAASKDSKAPGNERDAHGNIINASPLARRLAADNSVSLAAISGTGPKGRITSEDVEEFIARGGSSNGVVKRNPLEFTTYENSLMRKTIARRLLESKQQVPHFYLTVDCNLEKLLDAREQINHAAAHIDGKPIFRVSVNDMIIKASALALKKVPDANASWYDDAIVKYNNVDISVAVATDGGLITPIIRNADQKTLVQISNEMKELAKRARENKLRPEEFQGGGFSISNLGMFGIKHFAAIVNPPQSCILAVGAGEERAIVKDGAVKIANLMTVTLSVDHRSVDGAVGAKFLEAFKDYIENPVKMLV